MQVIRGQPRPETETVARDLAAQLEAVGVDGTLYLGYPLLPSAEDPLEIDSLLLSKAHGVVVFLLRPTVPALTDNAEWQRLDDEQDQVAFALESNLGRHNALRLGRALAFKVTALTVFPGEPHVVPERTTYVSISNVGATVAALPPISDEIWPDLTAALQRVSTMRPPKKRAAVNTADSKGAVLKEVEREIANLDSWQLQAAIESPRSVQRIRGLAGSGKTVVLALKAAYLHARNPEWDIAVVFYSRALYQQLTDLIERFTFEQTGDRPDWNKLRLFHAWGGADRSGMYLEMARGAGATPRDYGYARSAYGSSGAFGGICREVLSIIPSTPPVPIFDAVLIDEAQDLPPEFFELVYHFTRGEVNERRVYYAYDELQSLSDLRSMPSPSELFGVDQTGNARVRDWADQVLRVCYRNSPWTLTLAHGLGLGVNRDDGLIQHFDEPGLWQDVGYRVLEGQLALGSQVVIERDPSATPEYFERLLERDEVVALHTFGNQPEQAEWIAQQIRRNLAEDELEHDDILVVLPDALGAQRAATPLIGALARLGISSHLVGVSSSRDEVNRPGNVGGSNP